MDREAWRAANHGVAKSWTRLSDWTELRKTKSIVRQISWSLIRFMLSIRLLVPTLCLNTFYLTSQKRSSYPYTSAWNWTSVLECIAGELVRAGYSSLWLHLPSQLLALPLLPQRIGGELVIKVEKAMAPHSSTLAWKISWMEEPGRLQSMGSRRVGHDWATSLSLFTVMLWRRKWQPTPVFLPGESQGWGSLVGSRLWGRTELDTTEVT